MHIVNHTQSIDFISYDPLIFSRVAQFSLKQLGNFRSPKVHFSRKRQWPRPLLDVRVPEDVSCASQEQWRKSTRVTQPRSNLSSRCPLCTNWNTPSPPLCCYLSPNRCCIPKKPHFHCATNRKSSVGLRLWLAVRAFEKFHCRLCRPFNWSRHYRGDRESPIV